MPLMDAKKKLSQGKIKEQDIPYMQRSGGRWDDSDVKGAKKKGWNEHDKNYNANARPKGVLDWMSIERFGAATTAQQKKVAPPKKKGWFGFSP